MTNASSMLIDRCLPGFEVTLIEHTVVEKPNVEWFDVTEMTPDEFAAFDDPGWGRIAAKFTLRPYGEGRTLLSYEARTATNDDDSAKRFARYWGAVRPFVGHVMRAALATVRRNAEHA